MWFGGLFTFVAECITSGTVFFFKNVIYVQLQTAFVEVFAGCG